MTKIINLCRCCIGVDLQPPLKPMRRREEDKLGWLRDDPEETIFPRPRRTADRRFVLIFIAGVVFALNAIALVPTGHGIM